MAKVTLTINRATAEVILSLCEEYASHYEDRKLGSVPPSVVDLMQKIRSAFPALSSLEYDYRIKWYRDKETG